MGEVERFRAVTECGKESPIDAEPMEDVFHPGAVNARALAVRLAANPAVELVRVTRIRRDERLSLHHEPGKDTVLVLGHVLARPRAKGLVPPNPEPPGAEDEPFLAWQLDRADYDVGRHGLRLCGRCVIW